MQYIDILTYLNDDILTKVDRASMANSLEVRVPLLDHRIVEETWRIPLKYKIKNGKTKIILRDLLNKYVPKDLYERPKMGFAIPLDSWLKTNLREWAHDIINSTDWESNFGIKNNQVKSIWTNFLKLGNHSATQVWILLSLGAWHKRF